MPWQAVVPAKKGAATVSCDRPFACVSKILPTLLDLDLLHLLGGSGLRQIHFENAVLELRLDGGIVDIVDVEGAAESADAAFAADVVALVVFFLLGLILFGRDGQVAVLVVEGNVFLLYARQLCRKLVALLLVLDIDFEGSAARACERRKSVLEERLAEHIEEAAETVIVSCQIFSSCKRYQTKHYENPFLMGCRP